MLIKIILTFIFCMETIAAQTAVEIKGPLVLRLPNSTETIESRPWVPGKALLLEARFGAGMFSVLDDVWAVLDCYEQMICSAIKIDFGTTGEYYDSKIGPNWFDYYFLPVSLGGLKKLSNNTNRTALHWLNESQEFPNTHFLKTDNRTYSWLVQHHPERLTNREEIIALWSKYVHVRPEIEHQIQQFVRANFESNFVIGIHYRGTDKSREAPRTKYEKVTEEIKHQVALRNLSHFKIFLATDEQAFVSYLESEFPNKIMYLSDTERSKDGKPLHLNKQDQQYKIGKAALLDSLLLSKTDLLIRTSSNLSRWSTYFNPDLPVIELSKRH